MKKARRSLSSSEWSFLLLFFVITSSLVLIAKVNSRRATDTIGKLSSHQEEFLVVIEGAVKKPGEYQVEEGTTVDAVLRKAGLSPFADLSNIPLKEKVTGPLRLKIEELKEVRIFVEGEILEQVQLVMPVGSRISDLKSKIAFTKETDKSFFRRRKLLRDGDKIVVPKKKA